MADYQVAANFHQDGIKWAIEVLDAFFDIERAFIDKFLEDDFWLIRRDFIRRFSCLRDVGSLIFPHVIEPDGTSNWNRVLIPLNYTVEHIVTTADADWTDEEFYDKVIAPFGNERQIFISFLQQALLVSGRYVRALRSQDRSSEVASNPYVVRTSGKYRDLNRSIYSKLLNRAAP